MTTDYKLVKKIERRIERLKEIIGYALGNASEVDAAHDELRVLEWAIAGAEAEAKQ